METNLKLKLLLPFVLALFITCGCSNHAKPKATDKGYIQVAEGKLFYEKFGSGMPIIVLHGGPGLDHGYLLPQMLKLAEDYEVVFYDQRGSGKSLKTPISPEYINIGRFTEDLEAVRAHLGYKKFILIGHSWGGVLAMNYAVTHPEHLSGLILLNSGAANFEGQKAFEEAFAKKAEPIMAEIMPLFNRDSFEKFSAQEISKRYRMLFSVYFAEPKNLENLTLNFNKDSARSGIKVMEEMDKGLKPSFNLFPQLKELNTPTLVVHGNEDIVPANTAREINDAILNARIIYLEDCGHFPYIEQPEKLFSAVRDFLEHLRVED